MAEDRNETPAEVATITPSWLADVSNEDSLGGMAEHRVVSRIKLVQAMSREELKDACGEGSVVIVPGNILLAEKKQPFYMVPLFSFTEFIQWADLEDDNAQSSILDRTYDKGSELAEKCRDFDRHEEAYGDDNKYIARNAEHLNFVCEIYGNHPYAGTEVALSFARGEFSKGKQFISALFNRCANGARVPMWANVFSFTSNLRKKGNRQWYGLDFTNPDQLFIDQADAERLSSKAKILADEFTKNAFSVSQTDDTADANAEASGEM